MPSSLLVPVVWLLAMLAAAAHAARVAGGSAAGDAVAKPELGTKVGALAVMAAVFLGTVALAMWLTPETGWVAMVAALSAAWRLARPGVAWMSAVLAGLCAGLAAGLYVANGAPVWVAIGVCVAVVGVVMVLAREATFAPARVRDGVMLGVACVAPVAAAAPEVEAGWRAAQALNGAGEAAARGVPVWTVVVVAVVLVAGAVHAMVRR